MAKNKRKLYCSDISGGGDRRGNRQGEPGKRFLLEVEKGYLFLQTENVGRQPDLRIWNLSLTFSINNLTSTI